MTWRTATRVATCATSVAIVFACACGGSSPAANGPGPVAMGRADREVGATPLLVCFDATASRGADGHSIALTWDFGDGSAMALDQRGSGSLTGTPPPA